MSSEGARPPHSRGREVFDGQTEYPWRDVHPAPQTTEESFIIPAHTRTMTQDNRDITEILTDEHRLFEAQFAQFNAAAEKRDWDLCFKIAREIRKGISVHSWLEEVYLYPSLARHADPEMQNHGIKEHKEMEEKLARAQQLDPRAGTVEALQFADLVREVEQDLNHHMRDEEDRMFPGLREKVTPEELRALGRKAQAARGSGPTHPHPGMPHKGVLANVAGRVLGAVDRVNDTLNVEE